MASDRESGVLIMRLFALSLVLVYKPHHHPGFEVSATLARLPLNTCLGEGLPLTHPENSNASLAFSFVSWDPLTCSLHPFASSLEVETL